MTVLKNTAGLAFFTLANTLACHAFAQTLETVTIQAEPLNASESGKPFSLIDSRNLGTGTGLTISERLVATPGIAQTGFAQGASRPVIRGQDSDRIKLLRNSSALTDASSISYDHALPVDPFSLTQIEVVRGPATLVYGGNAVGGAINLVDDRIARRPQTGLLGEANLEFGGASNAQATGVKLQYSPQHSTSTDNQTSTTGNPGQWHFRADAFERSAENQRAPAFTDPNGIQGKEVRNSSLDTAGGGFGFSYVHSKGYVGCQRRKL
ncbi:MAG: TonB-dependent receptor plug domain-containing protein [Limnobacter sp.]|nr:TonB-dependent receptor plug domain-containing protein [Limnobacter sp.]